jgi:hypothetical protein
LIVRESSHLTSVAPPSGTHLSLARPQEVVAGIPQELPVGRPKDLSIGRPRDACAAAQAAPKIPYAQTERTLLYVARTPDETLTAHLKSRGWVVSVARSSYEIGRLLKPEVACAGIVDLASFPARELAGLEASLQQQQVGWIALATEERLIEPDTRRLIRQYCFDYVKLPVANATVDYLVGHAFGMITLCDLDLAAGVACAGDDEMVGTCEACSSSFAPSARSRTPTRTCSSPANRGPARN